MEDVAKPVHGILIEEGLLTLAGFEIEKTHMAKENETTEKFPLDFDPYSSPNVVAMMRNMNYFPRMGLGRSKRGPKSFPKLSMAIPLFGLGYEPTDEDMLEIEVGKMAKAKGLPYQPKSMRPYTPTWNGKFVKAGETFRYCGFLKPRYDPLTNEKVLGFELFFDCKIEEQKEEKKESHYTPEDWANHMDPGIMRTLLGDFVININKKDDGDNDIPSIWAPTTARSNKEAYEHIFEQLEDIVKDIDIELVDHLPIGEDARSGETVDSKLVNPFSIEGFIERQVVDLEFENSFSIEGNMESWIDKFARVFNKEEIVEK